MSEFYQPSLVKKRRSTNAEIEARRLALIEIVAEGEPMTVRQVFYQATVKGVVEKAETGYDAVQRDLVYLRRSGAIPYSWLADNTRWQRRPQTFSDPSQALKETARLYRKSLWRDVWADVEIWLEKDALSGVVSPVTYKYDVPLMVARGYASLSFLHSAAEAMKERAWPTYIYHLGDFDPSGVNAGEKIEETIRELAGDVEIHFERLAVNEHQIRDWRLPSRPTKKSDSRAKNFGSDISVELDAIHPDTLRNIVETAINKHLPKEELDILLEAEASEREHFERMAEMLSG
jgi:hypothetical protein